MLQGLLKTRANKPRPGHDFAGSSIDHCVFRAVALPHKFFQGPLGRNFLKGTRICKIAQNQTEGAVQHFQKLGNGHTAVDGMQIDNGIRSKTLVRALGNVGKIFFIHQCTNDALLAMPIGNLVADLRHSDRPQTNSDLRQTIAVQGLNDFVDDKGLGVLTNDNNRSISANFAIGVIRGVKDPPDEDIAVFDA